MSVIHHFTSSIKAFLFVLLLSLSAAIPVIAQQTNSCGVVAKMIPEGDSVVTISPTNVLFQNASINATDYKFIIDNMAYPINNPVNWFVGVGLTTVKLVAYNGSCTDTTISYYFFSGQFPSDTGNTKRAYGFANREHEMNGILTLKDGSNLIFGHKVYSDFFHESQTGVVIKTKSSGCVEWGRKLPVDWNWASSVIDAKELQDGNIYLLSTLSGSPLHLTKITPTGNIIWNQSLSNGAGNYQRFLALEPTPDGGVVTISSPYEFTSFNITRFNINGQLVWQRHYDLNILWPNGFKNMLIKDGFVYFNGAVGYDNLNSFGTFISKINLTNGQTVWAKKYLSGSQAFNIGEMISADSTIVMSILANSGNIVRPTVGGIMQIDTAGNVLKASLITEIHIPNPIIGPFGAGTSHITLSGKNYYIITAGGYPLSLQGDGRSTKQIRLDSVFQVKWVNSIGGVGQARYYFNAPGPKEGSIVGGLEFSPTVATYSYGTMLSVVPVDSSGGNPNASCYFNTQNWEVVTPTINSAPVQWSIDEAAFNIIEPLSLPWESYFPEMRYKCPDYIDSCSYLKVTGPSNICNISQTYTYKSHKNKACGQPTNWSVPSGLQIINQTDSSVTIRIKSFGRYVIYGRNILSCVPSEDSLVIIAASSTPPVNLGADLQICPGNTKTLHAGKVYTHYEWQDGSTDSLLTINQPGQYWVKVTDSCDNILSDTINVVLAPPVQLSIGNDRIICENDTVHLTATPGFMNYQWSPSYQTSATTGQSIIVKPLVDTSYTIIGEMTPGCFGYDTVRVAVHKALAINLGNDKSFCLNDSLIIDAGFGFSNYKWNTGANSQQITVKSAGSYSVIATTNFGCKSYDTLAVPNVFALPQPNLDKNPVLCEGVPRLLNPGAGYTQYNWNTGSTNSSISINGIGSYSVIVTDVNGCQNADSTKITTIQPTPALFLPNDILICPYEKVTLLASKNFSSYLWNDGSKSPSITVNKIGVYWLQGTDQFGCIGKDSIYIDAKSNCLVGVFVPNAFTPNSDGKNDVFRPVIYGNILQYDFKIFNRFGAIIFQSSNNSKGWDGRVNGAIIGSNTFAWTLVYQLEGQPVQQQKGVVMLIR